MTQAFEKHTDIGEGLNAFEEKRPPIFKDQ